jgi:hypothetical protein
MDCPDFVIVDEAHGSSASSPTNQNQQQRHQLVHDIAALENRHLIMLTATPHSGVDSAFRSLLSLLHPHFGNWDVATLNEAQRIELARHFVQRTRRDIEHDWEGDHCFPQRDPIDKSYRLSKKYLELFNKTFDFCSEMVRAGQTLGKRQQRVRYWGALALLRCVMSSPAAAVSALETRHDALPQSEDEPDFRELIYDSVDDRTDDDQPTVPVKLAEDTLADADRRRLRELGRMAASLVKSADDTKLTGCAALVADLLQQGFQPIVWCRYIATAEYVANYLREVLGRKHQNIQVVAITGRLGDDERRAKIDEIDARTPHVLVATDCLSEGVNLQSKFNAALHYDLPWNPNRLEQREGRVDRYGQTAPVVKTIRYFSPDSAVDGAVIEVLLNKAREIHKVLGTHVPVPEESESVTEAVLNALFLHPKRSIIDDSQLDLGLEVPEKISVLNEKWDQAVARERINRTRFAQRALKPDEVHRELKATDAVLGDPDAVRNFVLNAAQRLGIAIAADRRDANVFRINVGENAIVTVPNAIKSIFPHTKSDMWFVSFISPTPQGADYLGRNHSFVASLARFLMEEALTKHGEARASRCGVIRTKAVERLTTILLLRVRYLVEQPQRPALLSEEVLVTGYIDHNKVNAQHWLDDDEALRLLGEAKPDANVSLPEKRKLTSAALDVWPALDVLLRERISARALELEKSHKRIRQAVGLRVRELNVKPQLPPDLLGILILQPVVAS